MNKIILFFLVILIGTGCSTSGIKSTPDSWRILTSTNPETGHKKTDLTNSGVIDFTCYSSRKSIYLGFGGEVTSVPSNAVDVAIKIDDGLVTEFNGYTGRDSFESGYAELYVVKARALLNEISTGKEITVKVDIDGEIKKYTENVEFVDEFVEEFMRICL